MGNSFQEAKRLFNQQDREVTMLGQGGNRRNRRGQKKIAPSPLAIMFANIFGGSLPGMQRIRK